MKLLSERLKLAMSEKTKRDGAEVIAADIARAARASDTSVSFWLSDTNGISAAKARLIAEYLGVNALWLETGKGSPYDDGGKFPQPQNQISTLKNELDDAPSITAKMTTLPVVGRVQAGADGLLHIDEYPPGHGDGYMVWWPTCENAYALRIRGESMSPRYLPGEYVGVDPCADVTPSDEVIVLMKDGRRMIKRMLWRRDDQVCLESVNKDFQNIVLDVEEIDKLHLVLGNIPKAAFRSNLF